MKTPSDTTKASTTLRDLARETGYSVTAVSCAIRGTGSISSTARNEILAKARILGYRPNLSASSLRLQRAKSHAMGFPVALLIWSRSTDLIYPPNATVSALLEAAEEGGFHLEIHTYQNPQELPRIIRMLYHRGVRGIFFFARDEIECYEHVDWSPFSVVTCGRWDTYSRFHNVGEDPFASLRLVWNEMMTRGYQRIGAAIYRHDIRILDDMAREGALHVLQNATTTCDPIPPFLAQHGNRAGMLKWVQSYRPDAVIGFHLYDWYDLREGGYRIPRDIGFACMHYCDDTGNVACVSDSECETGKEALRLMENLVKHHETGVPKHPQSIRVYSRFIPGKSLPDRHVSGRRKCFSRQEK